ncbi:MAG: tetratricopeptide repeat protein, partial [Pseudomonadota bacterium]|nr:tetratricopeptide repeat protein [Pseudomonadota bacterium]
MSHRLSRLIPSLLVLVLLTGCFETGHTNRAPVKEHDFVKATDSARDIPTDNPNNTEALASAGWSALFLEHHEDARANFKQLLDLASNDRQAAFDAMLGLAWINIKQNRFERAATLLDMAESRAQKWQRFMVLDARGWMAMGKDDTKAAKSFFEQEDSVIGFFQPLEDDPKVGLGWLAFNSGDYKEARVQFEEGLHRKSNCFYCRDGLAHIDLIENNPEQALDHVLEGLFVIRDHPNLSALLDRTLNIQTDPKISIKALERLVDHYPSHDIFRKRLTDALLAADKTDATAKTIEPIKNQDYYLDKASKLIRENAPDNARALLIQGEKTWPVSVKIKVMLVNAYIALDKPERALSKARAASRVDPVGADDTLIFSLFPVDMRQTLLFEQTWNLYYAGAYRSALI